MSNYTQQSVLLPSGLDEIGLKKSLVRLPEETLEAFKRRILLENRDGLDDSFNQIKKNPSRQVGIPEIAIARISLKEGVAAPKIQITASHVLITLADEEEPSVSLLLTREGTYFLTDLITALEDLDLFDIEILDSDYAYRYASQLRLDSTDRESLRFLTANYVNNLGVNYISTIRFNDQVIFKTELTSADDLAATGDFYIDYVHGIVISNDLQQGYVHFSYSLYPFILWWQPVKVFELNDTEVDYLIKDNLLTDSGSVPSNLNARGARYVNELLKTYPLEWGQ